MRTFMEQLEQEEIDDVLYDQVVNFLLDLDIEMMSEDMQDRYNDIMEELFGDEDMDPWYDDDEYGVKEDVEREEVLEFVKKKVRTSPAEKAKRKRLYRKNKAKIKKAAKKRRKSASFKRYAKKAKRMAKQGKTATGKRQTQRV